MSGVYVENTVHAQYGGVLSFRVDFHCRVVFTCVNMDVSFTRVNKIETRYEVLRLIMKLSEVRLFIFTRYLSYIHSLLFENVNFTHVRT